MHHVKHLVGGPLGPAAGGGACYGRPNEQHSRGRLDSIDLGARDLRSRAGDSPHQVWLPPKQTAQVSHQPSARYLVTALPGHLSALQDELAARGIVVKQTLGIIDTRGRRRLRVGCCRVCKASALSQA